MPLLEAPRWTIDVERGPNWLFVRLHAPDWDSAEGDGLAEVVWHALEQHFATRVVLELDDVKALHSRLIGELVRLHKRIHTTGGILRLAGLSAANQAALRATRLNDRLACYRNREDAVMGHQPSQPR